MVSGIKWSVEADSCSLDAMVRHHLLELGWSASHCWNLACSAWKRAGNNNGKAEHHKAVAATAIKIPVRASFSARFIVPRDTAGPQICI